MRKFIIGTTVVLLSNYALANNYKTTQNQVKNAMISCLSDPDNESSAAWNSCLVDAAEKFVRAAQQAEQQEIKQDVAQRAAILKSRQVWQNAIAQCGQYTQLSYDGYGEEAHCKLVRSQDYYRYVTNPQAQSRLPDDLKQRMQILYFSY